MKKTIPLFIATVLMMLPVVHAEKEGAVRKPLPPQAEIDKLPEDGGPEFNRLVFETSPYLRQHARNPVDWFPWGREAFAKAKKEDKPIFLSVGYSSCHWCHVMEHESFEDPEIAKQMNNLYVCVKVDREERPDIDEIYMNATQAMTQRGGWPNSVWLTPEKKPWFCGTYFPPKDLPGRPGFTNVMSQLDTFWTTRRDDVEAQADALTQAVQQMGYADVVSSGLELGRELIEAGLAEIANEFDPEHGGFGAAPKFPPHGGLSVLLHEVKIEPRDAHLGMITTTLDKMAQGGMYDHVGGGFHRYATDAVWFLPHFEKMLYDNGQLGRIYTDAWVVTSNAEYRAVAEGIFDWALRDMRDSMGGFYSALDADSEGEEGKFYLWTADEVSALLGDDAADFMAAYQITPEGNYIEEATRERKETCIPHLTGWIPDNEKAVRRNQREILLKEREKRIWPGLDDKVLVNWNSLMIGALARAGTSFDRPDYSQAAVEAATFIMNNMKKGDRLLHTYCRGEATIDGYLDDYSFFINALLDLYEADGDEKWLDEAKSLVAVLNKHFRDENGGAYFYTASDAESLLARSKDPFDRAIPSGNGMMALAYVRMGVLLDSQPYLERGKEIVQLFDAMLPRAPRAAASMLLSLSTYIDATTEPAEPVAKADARAKGPNVQFDLTVNRKEVKPGDTIAIIAKYTLAKGWHIQSDKPKEEFVIPTEVKLKDDKLCKTLATVFPATVEFELGPDKVQGFSGSGQVVLTVQVAESAKPGKQDLVVVVGWQACDDTSCIAPEEFDLKIPITVLGE